MSYLYLWLWKTNFSDYTGQYSILCEYYIWLLRISYPEMKIRVLNNYYKNTYINKTWIKWIIIVLIIFITMSWMRFSDCFSWNSITPRRRISIRTSVINFVIPFWYFSLIKIKRSFSKAYSENWLYDFFY